MPRSASLFIAQKTPACSSLPAFLGAILEQAVSENVNRSMQHNYYYQNKLSATSNKKGHLPHLERIIYSLLLPLLPQH